MHVSDINLMGWIHVVPCLLALVAGGWNILGRKGTPRHIFMGRVYVVSMIVLNLSAFAIHKFDIASFVPFKAGPNVFGFFHWLAVFGLVTVLLGYLAATRQKYGFFAYLHPIMMTLSYYDLIGGGINEAFTRIDPLRAIAVASAKHAHISAGSPIVGLTQSAWMLATIVLLIYFVIKVALYRRGERLAAAA
jgi:uncharacterized membrane protein